MLALRAISRKRLRLHSAWKRPSCLPAQADFAHVKVVHPVHFRRAFAEPPLASWQFSPRHAESALDIRPWLTPLVDGSTKSFHTSSARYGQPYFAMKNSEGDTLRINLTKSRNFVGIRSTRCQRKYNQDRYKVMVLNPMDTPQPDPMSKGTLESQMGIDQRTLFYFAIFDGHGGSNTADFLTANLDRCIEECTSDMVPRVTHDLRQLGGYFRHFTPPFLKPYLPKNFDDLYPVSKSSRFFGTPTKKVHIKGKGGQARPLVFIPHPNATEEEQDEDIEALEDEMAEQIGKETTELQRLKESKHRHQYSKGDVPSTSPPAKESRTVKHAGPTSEFPSIPSATQRGLTRTPSPTPLEPVFDNHPLPSMTLEQRLSLAFLQCDTELIQNKYRDGSTASVVLLQSKGAFWETEQDLELVMAHVGDTRVLLCEAPRGESVQLSTDHHPDAVVETERIRKLSGYVTQDSFGENMFLGRLANTRSLGDIALKPFGVSAEPEIIRHRLKASQAAFLVLISDGISSVMSNQEVVDCIKVEQDPTQAAANILNLAEQLGAEDNCTAIVVRLPAWGTPMPDLSKELREYRWHSEAQISRARRR